MNNKPIRVVEGNAKPFEAFWQVRDADQTGGDPEILFFGYISEYSWMGDEITPKKFRDDLYSVGKGGPITIRMHSGGGEIFAAAAIRAMLLEYPGFVTVSIEGICASAAVAVALAGKKIKMFDTAYMLVHNPGYGFLLGYLTADFLRQAADELDLFKEGLLNAYETRTGMTRDKLSQMCNDETWMLAQQAVDLGFVDEVITGGSPVKKQDMLQAVRNYVNVPPALLNAVDPEIKPVENPANEQESIAGSTTAPVPTTQSRERLNLVEAAEKNNYQGVKIMGLRELLKQRSEKIARARALTELADKEARDFTDAERDEFEMILGKGGEDKGEVGELDAKIVVIQAERERLKAAESVSHQTSGAIEKPAAGKVTSMKRSEYDALTVEQKAAVVKDGVKIED